MRSQSRLLAIALVLSSALSLSPAVHAQTPTPPPQPASTFTTGTQLVVVDVVVQDRKAQPISGLKSTDFSILESKEPQALKSFDEHAPAATSPSAPPPPALPPGVFTNYSPLPPSPSLNVLLVDSLNTPMQDQMFVRSELRKYIQHAAPGTRIAIFGLTTKLLVLQSFTSDPAVLKATVDGKIKPHGSVLLEDPSGSNTDLYLNGDVGAARSNRNTIDFAIQSANFDEFEAMASSFKDQERLRYTLGAFNALAHYLVQLPGRKNLIWFSGSFPVNILPNAEIGNPFNVAANHEEEFRQTTNLLNRARVSVYPIDARGLQQLGVLGPGHSGINNITHYPDETNRALRLAEQAEGQEHITMDALATDTGGEAFYNSNSLTDAISKSINAGSHFYTLAYSPSNHAPDGRFRPIRVELQGDAASHGYKLFYRRGYYAEAPNGRTASATVATTMPVTGSEAYQQAAMQRAAPTPSEVLFKVRVARDGSAPGDKVLPHNKPNPNPNTKLKPPFRTYDIDFVAFGQTLHLVPAENGNHRGSVQFLTFVYDIDGVLLNADSVVAPLDLTPENYALVMKSGVNFHQQVSVPAKGESFLRIGVHDIATGRFGAVEIPTSAISALPPAAPATPPPSATSNHQ